MPELLKQRAVLAEASPLDAGLSFVLFPLYAFRELRFARLLDEKNL